MKQQPWAIVISKNGLSIEEGQTDIFQLLAMLESTEKPPVKLYFTTEGVSLVAAGSPILFRLKKLQDNGVEMVACRTCLDYMGLRDHVEVGHVNAMEHIIADMERIQNVVSL
ncbi:MAG: DsrE family protein [Anaerolineales bacterium]|jgi:intracellular sulfur oxidation DsrE/DsrF family protein|nr:MAG: DsrE family protein [Anaerolineales bacterium]